MELDGHPMDGRLMRPDQVAEFIARVNGEPGAAKKLSLMKARGILTTTSTYGRQADPVFYTSNLGSMYISEHCAISRMSDCIFLYYNRNKGKVPVVTDTRLSAEWSSSFIFLQRN